jgi:deazaflavin-dependent oxidoreductase (nitroreductase family)
MDLDRFFSRLNPAISAMLRSRLHWLLSPGLMLLTVTGRRTGRRYTIPVGYQRDGEIVTVMVSKAPRKQWWRNYRESASVELWLRGRVRHGRAEVVATGSEEFRSRCERTLRRMPWLGHQFGIEYDRRQGIAPAQLEALGAEIAIVRITLEGSPR